MNGAIPHLRLSVSSKITDSMSDLQLANECMYQCRIAPGPCRRGLSGSHKAQRHKRAQYTFKFQILLRPGRAQHSSLFRLAHFSGGTEISRSQQKSVLYSSRTHQYSMQQGVTDISIIGRYRRGFFFDNKKYSRCYSVAKTHRIP